MRHLLWYRWCFTPLLMSTLVAPVSKCLYWLEQGGKISTGLGTALLSPGAEVSAWTPQAVFRLELADGGMAE